MNIDFTSAKLAKINDRSNKISKKFEGLLFDLHADSADVADSCNTIYSADFSQYRGLLNSQGW